MGKKSTGWNRLKPSENDNENLPCIDLLLPLLPTKLSPFNQVPAFFLQPRRLLRRDLGPSKRVGGLGAQKYISACDGYFRPTWLVVQ